MDDTRTPPNDGATVLVIDDDADILQSVRVLLTRHGLEVLTAPGPAEGLRVLTEQPVDAVLPGAPWALAYEPALDPEPVRLGTGRPLRLDARSVTVLRVC